MENRKMEILMKYRREKETKEEMRKCASKTGYFRIIYDISRY